jgi:hypothetical protein
MTDNFPNEDGGVNKTSRPRKQKQTQSQKAKTVSDEAISIVWEYWLAVMASKRAVLDNNRKTVIGSAIYDYGIEGCKQAIDGCASSPFHMGVNSQQVKYNSIGLIFRNAEKTEDFIQRADKRDPAKEWVNEDD